MLQTHLNDLSSYYNQNLLISKIRSLSYVTRTSLILQKHLTKINKTLKVI